MTLTSLRGPRVVGCVAGGVLGIVAALPAVADISTTGLAGSAGGVGLSLVDIHYTKPDNERFVAEIVERELRQLSSADTAGAKVFLVGKTLRRIGFEETSRMAAEHNLGILVSREALAQRRHAVAAAESAFDTALTYSISHSETHTRDRFERIVREREEDIDWDALGDNIRNLATGEETEEDQLPGCVFVDGVIQNADDPSCREDLEVTWIDEPASVENTEPLYDWKGSVNVARLFSWGGSISASVESRYQFKTFYSLGGFNNPADINDPLLLGTRFPWTSNASVNISSPLPYTKNFGEDGNQGTVAVNKAELGRHLAYWNLVATANNAVGDAQSAYWSLVRSVLLLQVNLAHTQALTEMFRRAEERYERRVLTQYEMAQIQAELEGQRNQEEIAWGSFLNASNNLAEVLSLDLGVVLLPVDYTEILADPNAAIPASGAVDQALSKRAELKSRESAIDLADIEMRFRRAQTRPDVTFSASYSLKQFDTAIGYETVRESLTHLASPDQDDFFVGVSYNYPFGNDAVKSAYNVAQLGRHQATLNKAQTEVQVVSEVNSAVAGLLGANSEVKLAESTRNSAELTFQRAMNLNEKGLLTEFELLRSYRSVLSARSAHVQKLINVQQAQSELGRYRGSLVENVDDANRPF